MDEQTPTQEEGASKRNEYREGATRIPQSPPVENGELQPKKKGKWGVVVLSLVLSAVFFTVGWFSHYLSLGANAHRLLWAIDTTKQNYYEEIDEDALYEGMLGVLDGQLDDYSCFYTASQYAQIFRESQGQNTGLGIVFFLDGKNVQIFSVVENSPAQRAGLARAMYVLAYGTSEDSLTPIDGFNGLDSFVAAQEGEFILRCGYVNDGSSDVQNYTLKKEAYLAAYVNYRDGESGFSFRGTEQLTLTETNDPIVGLDSSYAYIRLSGFSGSAAEELTECLNLMRQRGKSNLILDLRGNGGGYMDVLSKIASHFVKNATGLSPVVATANYRNGYVEKYYCTGNDYANYFSADAEIRVLADESTASASECLIGAMLDYGTISYSDIFLRKDALTGEARSYGKGIMQAHYQNVFGDTMKLTVAKVCWPVSGKCIQGVGVTQADGANAVLAPVLEQGDTFLADPAQFTQTNAGVVT